MITLVASAFPWPGNQNPQQGYYYRSTPIPVLLLCANNLRCGARSGAAHRETIEIVPASLRGPAELILHAGNVVPLVR
jgi:hypothetical protein